jgi:hypothetical protein
MQSRTNAQPDNDRFAICPQSSALFPRVLFGDADRGTSYAYPFPAREALMFSVSWSDAAGMVSECRESAHEALALVEEVLARRHENVTITELSSGDRVSIETLRKLAKGQKPDRASYRTRVRAATR